MKFYTKLALMIPIGAVLLLAVVRTDYDHSVNFGKYKTYSWLKVQAGSSLWEDRIRRAVDNELAAKGWEKMESGGSAAVAAVGSVKNAQQLETFYDGFGGGWFWRGFGPEVATTRVENIRVGGLGAHIFPATTQG